LGYRLTGEQLQEVFKAFKELADKKKEVYDGDIGALIENKVYGEIEDVWSLVEFELITKSDLTASIKLSLKKGEEELHCELTDGDGPIDAAFLATEKLTGISLACKDFQVRSATIGRDAQGEVVVRVEHEGEEFKGRGVSTNTVEATIIAVLNAVNRIEITRQLREQ
jgi:2-isopropylmalate synthase